MTVWIVSRHSGALEWLQRQGIKADRQVTHLDISRVAAGDRVIGSLPVGMIADVCALGASYFHLDLTLRPEQRGRELSADEMDAAGARLVQYEARRTSASKSDKLQ